MGMAWGVMVMFVYRKNVLALKINNVASLPIAWWWAMLGDETVGFTAATYLSSFVSYWVASAPEVLLFVYSLFGENEWYAWWVNNIGWWVSIFGMGLPVIFSALQLGLPYG